MWVDDLKLTAFGLTQSLAQSYPGAVARFIEGFEQAGLKVFRGGGWEYRRENQNGCKLQGAGSRLEGAHEAAWDSGG